jgi:hypothetical protein
VVWEELTFRIGSNRKLVFIMVGMGIMMPIGIDLASVDHKKVCKENCQSSLGRIGPLQFVLQLGNNHLL